MPVKPAKKCQQSRLRPSPQVNSLRISDYTVGVIRKPARSQVHVRLLIAIDALARPQRLQSHLERLVQLARQRLASLLHLALRGPLGNCPDRLDVLEVLRMRRISTQ